MKKLLSLLLALVLVFSTVPMTALAAFDPGQYEKIMKIEGKWYGYITGDDGWTDIHKEMTAYLQQQKEGSESEAPVHSAEDRIIGYGSDTKYHWLQCSCGCKIGMEPHVDPLKTENDICVCGYQFSDNADLVVLWIDGAFPIRNFRKDVTEYEIKAHTYKDFPEVKISTFTHDSEATVEYPGDLSLKEGKNVYEIKVTSENKKVTKTYTVTVVKESK